MARRKIIAGNWKMNMTPSEADELLNNIGDYHHGKKENHRWKLEN